MKLTARTIVLETLAVLVLLVLVAAGALAWRLSRGPLDMALLKPRVEAALTGARGGRPVTLDALALEWSPDKRRIQVAVRGLTAYDAERTVQAVAARGSISFDSVSMLRGKVKIVRMALADGRMSVYRNAEGLWKFGEADRGEPPPPSGPAFDFSKWRDILPPLRDLIRREAFTKIDFRDVDIRIVDDVSGVDWLAEGAFGSWSADDKGVRIDISADLKGEGAPDAIQATLAADAAVSGVSFEIGVMGADPRRLASLIAAEDLPFRYEGVADLTFGGDASDARGLRQAQFSAAGENGVLIVDERRFALSQVALEFLFDMQTRKLDVPELSLETDRASGFYSGSVDLSDFFKGVDNPRFPFRLTARDAHIDATPIFDRSWDIQSADVTGAVSPGEKALDIDRAIARSGELNATGSGRIHLEQRPLPEDPDTLVWKVGAKVEAAAEGKASPQQILQFWPVSLGASARSWVADHVHGGAATRLDFVMDLQPEIYQRGFLDNDTLTLDFRIQDGDVSFLSDLPHVTQAKGTGRLRGNSLTIDLESGEMGGWTLDKGRVDLPQFHPDGEELTVTASGRGDLRQIMTMLDGSRLNIGEDLGEDNIARYSGLGGLDVEVRRPIGENVTAEDVRFSITGGFVDATAPNLAAGFGLEKSDVTVDVDNDRLILSGRGRFGPAPVEFRWTDVFDKDDGEDGKSARDTSSGTDLHAVAVVTPDFLNAFGVAARNVMQGEAEVELDARGEGRNFSVVNAKFDLTRAAIDLSEIGWVKQANAPATGIVRYGRDASGNAVATGDIKAEGLELSGEATFSAAGFQRAQIERIYAEDKLDLRGSLVRSPEGDYAVDVSGPFLDASPWIDGVLNMGASGAAKPAEPDPNAGRMTATVAVDELEIRPSTTLRNAKLVLETHGDALDRALLAGTIGASKGLEALIERDAGDRVVSIKSDDAGFVVRALTDAGYFVGGRLDLQGRFGPESGAAQVKLADVRLKNAPLLAQIFSLASLQGLSDVLSGDGVLFTEVEAPLRFGNGRIDMPGVRMSGPALGLTARGWLELGDGDISLDGVVVPSFGVNSALGGIPIIGDLFVSRKGEGVFAVVYSVRGSLEKARVAINPLSAVTPGFLRRILENPGEKPPEPEPTAP